MKQPRIVTEALILRPYTVLDSARVSELAGDIRVAESTLNIPHPYDCDHAKDWISHHEELWLTRRGVVYAITLKASSELVGTVGLVSIDGCKAELGYWVGFEYWGKGYCTEAAAALLATAQEQFSISYISAEHLATNPASGCVMRKLGMKKFGDIKKPNRNGVLCDVEVYEISLL